MLTKQQWHSNTKHYKLVARQALSQCSVGPISHGCLLKLNMSWALNVSELMSDRVYSSSGDFIIRWVQICNALQPELSEHLDKAWVATRCKLSWIIHILDPSRSGGLCAIFAGCIFVPSSCVLTDFSEPEALVACYKYLGTADASAHWCNPLCGSHVFVKTLPGNEDGAACCICWTRYWDM